MEHRKVIRTLCTITEAFNAPTEAQQRAAIHTPRTLHNCTVYIDGHWPTRADANQSERLILTSLRIILMVNIFIYKKKGMFIMGNIRL